MKGLRFAKKSITRVWRPIGWILGFTPRRRRPNRKTETPSQPAPIKGLDLNVMSFNIRRGTAKDGRNHWVFRRNRVQEILNHYRPDVLGLQEAMDFQVSAIRTMLPGYEMVGVGNMGGSEGLHNAIFYDADTVHPVGGRHLLVIRHSRYPGIEGMGKHHPANLQLGAAD